MLADDAARVFAVRAGLAAEAGGPSAILHRQTLGFEDFVAVKVRHRHFRGGNKPQVVPFELEEVPGELRQLARAVERRGIDHEGRKHFRIAVLAGVNVEHEVRERALEPGAKASIHGESRPGDLGRAFEVQNSERRPQVPVSFGLEIEFSRLPPAPGFPVVG